MQEVDNLGQTLLRLVFTGDIGKGHACLLLHIDLCIALGDTAHEAAPAPADTHAPNQEVHRDKNQNDRQKERRAREQQTSDVKALPRHDRARPIELLGQVSIAVHARCHIVQGVFLALRFHVKANYRIADFRRDNRLFIDAAQELRVRDLFDLRAVSPADEGQQYSEKQQEDRQQHEVLEQSAAKAAPAAIAVITRIAVLRILVLLVVLLFSVVAAHPARNQTPGHMSAQRLHPIFQAVGQRLLPKGVIFGFRIKGNFNVILRL